MAVSEHVLNDSWCLYFHDPNDASWEKDTQLVATVKTVEDYVAISSEMKDMWNKGMFFLMRKHIRPEWEDEHCRAGGCLSYKIMKPEVARAWFELSAKALGESLLKDIKNNHKICGVSLSPKRSYCILRIWISHDSLSKIGLYNLNIPSYSAVMFKKHLGETDKA